MCKTQLISQSPFHIKGSLGKLLGVRAYARQVHQDQFRGNGLPYISHPRAVERLFIKMYGRGEVDWKQSAVAYAHDVLEHGGSFTDLEQVSGDRWIPYRVQALSHLSDIDRSDTAGRQRALEDSILRILEFRDWLALLKLCDVFVNLDPNDLNPKWDLDQCQRYQWEKEYTIERLGRPWPGMVELLEDRLYEFNQAYEKKFKGSLISPQ